MIIGSTKERIRFFRFAIVGTIGAVVDFGVFNLLIRLGLPSIFSSIISFILAVINNFVWNRYWTYPDSRSKPLSNQMVQFILVSVVGLGIRAVLFALLEKRLIALFGIWNINLPLSPEFLGHNTTLTLAILIVLLWNFLANRYWTYNDIT